MVILCAARSPRHTFAVSASTAAKHTLGSVAARVAIPSAALAMLRPAPYSSPYTRSRILSGRVSRRSSTSKVMASVSAAVLAACASLFVLRGEGLRSVASSAIGSKTVGVAKFWRTAHACCLL